MEDDGIVLYVREAIVKGFACNFPKKMSLCSVWNRKVLSKEKYTKKNHSLLFGFIVKKYKRKSNIIKIPQNFTYI